MPVRYAPLPNPAVDHDVEHEMDAAFDDSDDEHDAAAAESRPLTRGVRARRSSAESSLEHPLAGGRSRSPTPERYVRAPGPERAVTPGGYDFDSDAYDLPPPGSPPSATQAFANDFGNSNGVVPSPVVDTYRAPRRGGWLRRSAGALLPAHYVSRLGLGSARPAGTVGGGSQNDGVFANVTAKPSRGVQIREGDTTYIVSEESQAERPPSYAAAQADSVPTYWEATTVHVQGGSTIPGEVLVDGVPTGTLFSFLWNALISVSFQFVGFILTYVLHTTHAAKLGSRAGLGITLIQYGFNLRKSDGSTSIWEDSTGGTGESVFMPPMPTMSTAKEQEDVARNNSVVFPLASDLSDVPVQSSGSVTIFGSEGAAEWLAFLLMTVGWFILLTSLLGFWRVKRWERSMLASPPTGGAVVPPARSRMESFLDFPGLSAVRGRSILSQGLDPHTSSRDMIFDMGDLASPTTPRTGDREERRIRPGHTQFVIDEQDPERAQRVTQALVAEQRLNMDLRAAGLL